MNDALIAKLKDRVVETALKVIPRESLSPNLQDAIDDLEAALRPDPWELLAEIHEELNEHHVLAVKIESALKWREENPDD